MATFRPPHARLEREARRIAQLEYARNAIKAGFDDAALVRVFGLSTSDCTRLRGQVRAA
jgi:hypothetical protein